MFLVMKLQKWDKVTLEYEGAFRPPIPSQLVHPENGSIGFLEVFDTKENAIKEYGENTNLTEIK